MNGLLVEPWLRKKARSMRGDGKYFSLLTYIYIDYIKQNHHHQPMHHTFLWSQGPAKNRYVVAEGGRPLLALRRYIESEKLRVEMSLG
jgi:hypothetical protein